MPEQIDERDLDANPRWNRRALLQAGAVGLGGLALAAEAGGAAAATTRPIKNCIFIWCTGGPSQLETWDPKPDAPAEYRGPYGALETNVPGIRISEILPRLARHADRYALVRSVNHAAATLHETGHQLMQTGTLFPQGVEWPHFGAVVSHLAGAKNSLPPFVVLPRPVGDTGLNLPRGQKAGFLGAAHEPFLATGNPAEPSFTLASLLPEPDESGRAGRRRVLSAVAGYRGDTAGNAFESEAPVLRLPESQEARQAFDLTAEKDGLRDRYGRSTFGQSCLLARRLVEHGVRFVTVNQFSTVFQNQTWDCHGYPDLPTRVSDLHREVAPTFDRAVSALIEDLVQRGLYEETLVCCFGEFGRTPKLNAHGGRDHHAGCWSVLLGGAGLRGGQVIGATDARGAGVTERPVSPAMLAATVYHALGLPATATLPGPEGRPVPLTPSGTAPLAELL